MVVKLKVEKNDAFKNLEIALKTIKGKVAKVGWFQGSKYPDKKQTPVAYVAAIQEFGSPSKNIPSRSFLRSTIIKKENEWKKTAYYQSKLILNGKQTSYGLMEIIGKNAVGDIQKTIESIWSPALKPSTIKNRINKYSNDPQLSESTRKSRKSKLKKFVPSGLYKPLQDTDHMIDTIINLVEDEK